MTTGFGFGVGKKTFIKEGICCGEEWTTSGIPAQVTTNWTGEIRLRGSETNKITTML